MRASTLFALTVALVLGLAAAAAAKYAGVFDRKTENVAAPPPPAEPLPKVLVAGTNLFKGITITSNNVRVRDLRPDELDDYRLGRKDYITANVGAANQRVMAENVIADTPLKTKHFEPQAFDNLGLRIDPHYRAVNVSLMKDKAGGGVIQMGDHVDVLITSRICEGACTTSTIRSTVLARDCKVIMKRNLLQTVLQNDPADKPVSFTLQANPYRAALIEFAQSKGQLSIIPRPKPRGMMMTGMGEVPMPKTTMPDFSDPDSKEYAKENDRVESVVKGEYSLGDEDLVRVFNLPAPGPKKETAPPPVVAAPPVRIVNVKGVNVTGFTQFGQDPPKPAPPVKEETRGYQFGMPNSRLTPGSGIQQECESCGKKDGL